VKKHPSPKKKSTAKPRTKRPTPLDAEGVAKSPSFRKAASKAESYAKDPKRLRKLFEEASKKAREVPTGPFAEKWAYFMAMIRLIRAYYRREYRDIPWQHFLLIIAAIIYFVMPFDAIPDWIPFAGMIDDAFVISFALRSVRADLDAFMAWETSKA
jgi:uncharacterized membrane protein YkvA (DUF1232 family)